MNDDMNNRRNELVLEINENELLQMIVEDAEEGHTFIEMGRQGPKISVVSSDRKWTWCLDEPDKSVPLIEKLIPQLDGWPSCAEMRRGRKEDFNAMGKAKAGKAGTD